MTPRLFLLLFGRDKSLSNTQSLPLSLPPSLPYLILETVARVLLHPITKQEDHQQCETVSSCSLVGVLIIISSLSK